MENGGIQALVKGVCSISYVSEKLQVSRPSLYKYMDLYDSGDLSKIPDRVLRFFRFLVASPRTEDDAILYFIRESQSADAGGEGAGIKTECLCGGGRAMVMFPSAQDFTDVVVEVLVRGDSGYMLIGEYRPEPGMRFVTIGNLVPGHMFYYRLRMPSGEATDPVGFTIPDAVL